MAAIVDHRGMPMRSQSAYEGATRGPRASNWHAPSVGPNMALAGEGQTLAYRTRHGFRNSLLLRSAISKNTTSEVGKGFTLLSTCKNNGFKDNINHLWKQVVTELDPWGALNFNALLHLAVMSRRMSGEVFIRKLRRPLSAGLAVPVQVELYESDMCPIDYNRRISRTRRIIQGIEFAGKIKVAVWFYLEHPGEGCASLNRLERVPIENVIHHYMPTRPGQIRGEPQTSAALLKDNGFHQYDDAELERKKTRAGFAGFLYREGGGEDDWEYDPATGKSKFEDGEGGYSQSETVRSGTMLRGVPGEKLELFSGDDTGAGYKDYMRWQSLLLAAGQDVPHPMLTGDWSGLNDRLVRAVMNEYRRGISFEQSNLSGFQVAFGIWKWVLDTAILSAKLHAPSYAVDPQFWRKVDIRPDAWKHQHPEQDINARKKAIGSNVSNVAAAAAEYGEDLENNMRENARAKKRWMVICEEEGLPVDTPMDGIFAQPEPAGELEDE